MSKLWLISRTTKVDYDEYDSAVVCAASENEARHIHPDGPDTDWSYEYGTWEKNPQLVTARYIGEAAADVKAGEVICSSFNAG